MTKRNRKYIIVLALCFTGLLAIRIFSPKPINWEPSYSRSHKIPYGTSALYSMLPGLFPGQPLTESALPLYNTLGTAGAPASGSYIMINETFRTDSLDLRALLNFVKKGNAAFIAANSFEGAFGDSLKLETAAFTKENMEKTVDSATLSTVYYGRAGSPVINFANPALRSDSGYTYRSCFSNIFFSAFDTARTTALGYNSEGHTNFIAVKMGKGTIYISSVPEAFCNYHLVHERNDAYAVKALSYLPDGPLTWDEYYKAGRHPKDTPLRVIFSKPALAMAYYVLMASLLVFIVIGVKRRQRIIPVIEPLQNTTLQFVDVVGSLYYQAGNHKNIAEKKISYFLEYIRTAFQVPTSVFDDAFFRRIISLSAIDKEKIHALFSYIAEINFRPSVTQEELIRLNRLIEEFHSLNKR